jgi:peptide/nickel transport system permease protein
MHILRKLGFYLVALWAAITLNFAIPRMLPGNPVDIMLGKLAQQAPWRPAPGSTRPGSSPSAAGTTSPA